MEARRAAMMQWGGHIALVFIVAVMLFPHFVMLSTSLKTLGDVYSLPPTWLPRNLEFQNYLEVWRQIPLLAYLRNSLLIATGATLLNVVLAFPAAYAVARLQFPGRMFFLYSAISLQMFGPEIIIVGLFSAMATYGLLDNLLSLVLINAAFNLPFSVWLLQGYLRTVSTELDDAALVDGASSFQILTRVIAPVAKPALIVVVIVTFINSWNEFVAALTLIADPLLRPVTVGLFGFVGLWETKWNLLMAGALITAVPMMVLFGVIMRQVVGGLMLGGYR